jgi:hypothetical protein
MNTISNISSESPKNDIFHQILIKKVKIQKIYIKKIIAIYILFYLFYHYIKLNKNFGLIYNIINYNRVNFKLDYENKTFAILKRETCYSCGLFSYYKLFLGCVVKHLIRGEIPIIDMQTDKNMYNRYNSSSNENPWESFFSQIDGYSLISVKKYAKKIKYYICHPNVAFPDRNIFFNLELIKFWHNMAKIYMQIKENILKEANNIMKSIFKGNKNVLGILMRGTDFIAARPKNHPIPPKIENVMQDIRKMDNKNNYKYYFLSTEDDIIRNAFIKKYGSVAFTFSFPFHFFKPFSQKKVIIFCGIGYTLKINLF